MGLDFGNKGFVCVAPIVGGLLPPIGSNTFEKPFVVLPSLTAHSPRVVPIAAAMPPISFRPRDRSSDVGGLVHKLSDFILFHVFSCLSCLFDRLLKGLLKGED